MARRTQRVRLDEARQVIDATMELAAERGWRRVSLAEIAERAGRPLIEVYEEFPDKVAILAGFLRRIDEEVLRDAPPLAEGSPRDRLFDVLMRRFEALLPYRPAIRAIGREAGQDPLAALYGARHFYRAMALMLEAAGIGSSGPGGAMRVNGLAAVYAYAFRTWLDDDSEDMARTMASLDRALDRAETIAAMIWRGRRSTAPRQPEPPPGEASMG